ncbi:MAG: anthranilate synthase component II [Dehalococcoidia bacterium]
MIILIDNYDSFTYNLYQYMTELGAEVKVFRNDEIEISEIEKLSPEKLVISPGPSNPENAGISEKLIKKMAPNIPILGVCLGHQCIGSTFGAKVGYAGEVKHGKVSVITHDEKGVFKNIKNPLKVVRYHSLSIEEETLPDELEISARSESGVIMGVRHKNYNIEGIQFHPESIFTESGKEIINNFLKNGK